VISTQGTQYMAFRRKWNTQNHRDNSHRYVEWKKRGTKEHRLLECIHRSSRIGKATLWCDRLKNGLLWKSKSDGVSSFTHKSQEGVSCQGTKTKTGFLREKGERREIKALESQNEESGKHSLGKFTVWQGIEVQVTIGCLMRSTPLPLSMESLENLRESIVSTQDRQVHFPLQNPSLPFTGKWLQEATEGSPVSWFTSPDQCWALQCVHSVRTHHCTLHLQCGYFSEGYISTYTKRNKASPAKPLQNPDP
jgi:hypothetical protein